MMPRTRNLVAFAVVLAVATAAGVWLFKSGGAETDPPVSQV
ncbi:MAG: hypothetical protein QOJ72_379, partial [Nocardioidaceae bacterium]|nr:hypothetical protein [Nocardioidaceae bacterium]